MPSFGATVDGSQLVLDTGRMRRVFRLTPAGLIGIELRDHADGSVPTLPGDSPDFAVPGLDAPPDAPLPDVRIDAEEETDHRPAHIVVTVEGTWGPVAWRRMFRLFEGCPAIGSTCALRLDVPDGTPPAERAARAAALEPWRDTVRTAGTDNIEDVRRLVVRDGRAPRLERLCFAPAHRVTRAVSFRDATDRANNLVRTETLIPYRVEQRVEGNLLYGLALPLSTDAPSDDARPSGGWFLLREAPLGAMQHAACGFDFDVARHTAAAYGLGFDPDDLVHADPTPDGWVEGHGVAVGVGRDEDDLARSVNAYLKTFRTRRRGRDHYVLVNTWGDRGQDARINEAFALREIDACRALGATHLQLDDGWQKGQSSNSATPGGSFAGIWDGAADYWTPHPTRFPRGLGPVVDRARAAGVEIALWFNPAPDGDYAHWREDADAMLTRWRTDGIRIFKIDGVRLETPTASRRLRAMLDRAREASKGALSFNLDVTAGRRWGYFVGQEYGTLFLENRYTDWGNYYPHWTLANLWHLSAHVPAESLQIEWLNGARNRDRYPEDDPLAPGQVPPAYAFAATLAAQPLGWFEAQSLPDDHVATVGPLIRAYLPHQAAFHDGWIRPVGDAPSGTGWTGFQSVTGEDTGYWLVLREWTARNEGTYRLAGLTGRRLRFERVLEGPGAGSMLTFDVVPTDHRGETGLVSTPLSTPYAFVLYRYGPA